MLWTWVQFPPPPPYKKDYKMFKNCEPKFIENSKIPVWLSKIAPIRIGAISLVFWVFARGTMSDSMKRHETIHFRQWLELGIIGFAFLYGLFWLIGLIRFRDAKAAYRRSPFEVEAYDNEADETYLDNRRWYAWARK